SSPSCSSPPRSPRMCRVRGPFLVSGPPLLGAARADTDTVTIEDGTLAIASGCDAIPARLLPGRRGTRVRAASSACGEAPVRFAATIRCDCRKLHATVGSPPPSLLAHSHMPVERDDRRSALHKTFIGWRIGPHRRAIVDSSTVSGHRVGSREYLEEN